MDSRAPPLPSATTGAAPPTPPATPAPVWQLQLLGRVQLRSAQRTIVRWPSRAVASLAARLALAPQRSHPREELIELLWPGVTLDKGRPRLRQALSLLRGLLRDGARAPCEPLLADRLALRLNPQAMACDVLVFERLVAQGAWADAGALYAGELMPGYYDDWVVAERHRLEALHGRLALAPAATAQPPATAQPTAEALALAQAPATRLCGLPAYWTRAFGHAPLLATLARQVQARRLVTLLGPGGQGKTRLAVALAQWLADARPAPFEQLVFVPLADAQQPAALWQALWQALAQALANVPAAALPAWPDAPGGWSTPPAGGAAARRVQALIGQRGLLLVLDNLEQLDEAAAQALPGLLQACPRLSLLLTSRRRLGLAGEQVFELPALAQGAAQALFVDRARESRPEFQLTRHNAAAVAALVRWLGGMPLAIELAASRLRAMQPRELLQRLQHDPGSPMLDLLARPSVGVAARGRHASMRQVVAWSWRQLAPAAAALLRAMSVFGAPATAEAVAQALAGWPPDGCGAPSAARVQALLADAVEASLVQVCGWTADASPSAAPSVTSSGPPGSDDGASLYALPAPVREYAAEQCRAGEATAARGRLRRWLAGLARQGLPGRQAQLRPDLQHGWGLLLQARADDAPQEALALAVALQGEWSGQALSAELVAVTGWALACQVGGSPDALQADGHYLMAVLHQLRAEPGPAATHADQAVANATDDGRLALALSIRCWIRQERGDLPDAVQPELDAALALARRGPDRRALALILRLQGAQQAYHRNDPAAAEAWFSESVRLFQGLGDQTQTRLRQIELAHCWARRGRLADAQALLDRCMVPGPATAGSPTMVYALTVQGQLCLQQRAPAAARQALVQAARRALDTDWQALLLPALLPLPAAQLGCGQADRAALLQGHLLARWPATLGQFNRWQARTLRRNRRLLRLALGGTRALALLQAGGALTPAQALSLAFDADDLAAGAEVSSTAAPRPCPAA